MTPRTRSAPVLWAVLLVATCGGVGVSTALAQAPGGGTPDFKQPPPSKDTPAKKDKAPALPEEGTRGEKVDLRPRFEKGSEIRYSLKMNNESKGTITGLPGMPAMPTLPDIDEKPAKDGAAKPDAAPSQQMEQQIDFVLRVKDTDPEKGSTVELVYERARIKMTTGDSTFESDSEKPAPKGREDEDILRPFVQGMVGTTITMEVDPSGNITKVSGGDNLMFPGMMQKAGLLNDPKTLGPLFGPLNTKKSGSGLAAVGDKWSNIDNMELGPFGAMKMTTEHTLRSHKNAEAEVFFNGRTEPNTESGSPAAPLKLAHTSYRGKYTWDTRLGQLKAMENELEVTMEGPGAGGGTMTNKSFTRIERLPAKPATKKPAGK